MMLPVIIMKLLEQMNYTRQLREKRMYNRPSAFFLGGFPVLASVLSLGRFLAVCVHKSLIVSSISSHIVICWLSPSHYRFYRLIAGYERGVGDHRVGQ
jgi:hypothetical protein